jgi:ribosomal protein L37AE/L43A
MDGIIWLFPALMVVLVALALVLVAMRRRPSAPNPQRHCSNCQTPMSLRRVSLFEALTLRGVWMCPHCGTRMSKAGKRDCDVRMENQ